jgi:RND superfamily putative drug exporter
MLAASSRLIYRRRYVVLAIWAAVAIAAAPFLFRAGDHLKAGGFTRDTHPSTRARAVLQERLGFSTVSLELIFERPGWTAFQPEFVQAVLRATAPLSSMEGVSSVRTHFDDPRRASASGRYVHVTVGLDMRLEDAVAFIDTAVARIDPGPLTMTVTGSPALYRDITLVSESDLRRSEAIAFPLAALTLLLVFGTVVAAVAPAAVGGAGVAVALAALYFVSRGVDVSVFALNITSLLGIGLGIDYALFYTSRFREELAGGASVPQALEAAQSKAGLTVLFSAVTSLIGLASLLAFDSMVLRSVGLGAVLVIAAALLASVTLMPALLGVLGHNINRLRVGPRWEGRRSIWAPLSEWVMRRPLTVLIPTAALLVLLAWPVKDLELGTVDATVLPQRLESRQGFDILRDEFGFTINTFIPVAYTFGGDPFSAENLEPLYNYGRALEGLPGVRRVTSIVNLDRSYTLAQYRAMYAHPEAVTDIAAILLLQDTVRPGTVMFAIESAVHPFSSEARRLVAEVRALTPPRGHAAHVDGGAAEVSDIISSIYGRFPLVIAAVIVVTYLSLLVLFRSVLLPLKAVVLNVLSILASYGALVFIFQQGHFSGLLGFNAIGVIESTTPVLLFAILFGLSMDYEIFLLSRVAEAWRRTGDNRASVAEGLQKSGLIITGAAAILIVVAASFIAADIVIVKAIGLGLALAVFVDVTVVRALVAPALMRLAGKWNWWLPGWLDRVLPVFGDHGGDGGAPR